MTTSLSSAASRRNPGPAESFERQKEAGGGLRAAGDHLPDSSPEYALMHHLPSDRSFLEVDDLRAAYESTRDIKHLAGAQRALFYFLGREARAGVPVPLAISDAAAEWALNRFVAERHDVDIGTSSDDRRFVDASVLEQHLEATKDRRTFLIPNDGWQTSLNEHALLLSVDVFGRVDVEKLGARASVLRRRVRADEARAEIEAKYPTTVDPKEESFDRKFFRAKGGCIRSRRVLWGLFGPYASDAVRDMLEHPKRYSLSAESKERLLEYVATYRDLGEGAFNDHYPRGIRFGAR